MAWASRRLALILALAPAFTCRAVELRAEPAGRFADSENQAVVRTPRAQSGSWATERARALTVRAERYAKRGDAALALTAYNEAIRTDASFGPAYLGLGMLREAMSDFSEAHRLYQMATQLPDAAPDAHALRAALLKKTGQTREALRELETAVRLDPSAEPRLRDLSAWYAEQRLWPAALAVARQLFARLQTRGASDDSLAAARVQIQALGELADQSDPVANGRAHPSWVRRALWRIVRRTMHPEAKRPQAKGWHGAS
jgi:tetratricopeptide (TPR) repeat protein